MLQLNKDERQKINGNVIEFGLGWDSAQETTIGGTVGGFLSKFTGSNRASVSRAIDLDASALLYSGNNRVGEVSFRTLHILPAGFRHSGDNRTGDAKGEDEIITIDTTKIPQNIDTIVLTINSFTGERLSSVSNAFCNIREDRNPTVQMNLNTKNADYTAVVMGRFYKKDGQWRFQNISEFTNARTASDMDHFIQQFL